MGVSIHAETRKDRHTLEGRPSPTNVGADTTGLTVYNGNMLITTAGTVVQNLDIHGYVKVNAANVTIQNCRIRGYQVTTPIGESGIGLISTYNAGAVGLVIDRCTLIPDYPSFDWDGVLGHDFTITRSLIAHVTDGFGIYNTASPGSPVNVTIDGCYVGYLAWFSPTQSGNSDNATHNDCIQILGGTNIVIQNNTLLGFRSMPDGQNWDGGNDPFGYVGQGGLTVAPTGYDSGTSGPYNPTYPSGCSGSVIQWNNSQGTPQMIVQNNYADGGGASFNVSVPLATGSQIVNNRFGRHQRLQGAGGDDTYTINGGGSSGSNLTVSNNVYDDNNDAVRWRP